MNVRQNANNVSIFVSKFGFSACVRAAYQESVLVLRVTNVSLHFLEILSHLLMFHFRKCLQLIHVYLHLFWTLFSFSDIHLLQYSRFRALFIWALNASISCSNKFSSITNDAEDKSWQMLYVGQSPTKWTVVQQYP